MEGPRAFGYKMGWLAARTVEPERLIAHLMLDEVAPMRWAEGIDTVYASEGFGDQPVFVTPCLDGWVLAASPAFFEEASEEAPHRLATFVAHASERLDTEVQLFVTHRVVEGHAWARAEHGLLVRALYYLGEVGEYLVDDGLVTEAEVASGFARAIDGDAEPNEAMVMEIARGWSVDPTQIEERFSDVADGWLGWIRRAPDSDPERSPAPTEARPWWRFW
ncbi:MAG: hypothetical protein OEN56_10860 [Gemmatimonadota bacterium]|nr:hypothetical protein [Gemmatimonadota bacterium]